MTPFRITLIFIAVTVIGIASGFFLEVDFTPNGASSSFVVSYVSDQNDPPLITEQKMTSILEGGLSGIEGLKKIESISRFGGGNITLEFEDVNLQAKRLQILTAIREIRNQLPDGSPFPSISTGYSDDIEQPLLIYSLSSPLPTNEIVQYAQQRILPEIGLNPGIKNVDLSTDTRPVVEIKYVQDQLHSFGLSVESIQSKLLQSIFNEQVGSVTSDGETKSIFVNTVPDDITELRDIRLNDNVRLGDVARIRITDLRPSFISRLNGENSILVRLFVHEHENKPKLATGLRSEIEELKASLPEFLSLHLSYDDTEFITQEMSKISMRALFSIGILSVLVLVVYRRLSQLLVLIGSVVVSLGMSSLIMYLFGVPVHLYTIAGLTISFGLVIDNSIMVFDHLRRKGNLKVITALLAATLTTIAALLVIYILPKEERLGMDDFASAISIALGSSVIVSLFFTPALSQLVGIDQQRKSRSLKFSRKAVFIHCIYERIILILFRYKRWLVILLILSFGLPVYLIPKNIEGLDWYNKSIGSEYYQMSIRPITDPILGGMLRSFYFNVFESSGYRTPEKTKLYVSASLDEGHTLEQMDEVLRNVEVYLGDISGLASFQSNIYSGTYAQVVIEFSEETENGVLPYQLKNRLIQRSLDWGGVDWNVYGVGRGFSNATGESLPSFRVKLMGYNYEELESLANEIASQLLSHPRIKEVNTNDRVSWRDAVTEQLVLAPNSKFSTDEYLKDLSKARNAASRVTPDIYLPIGNSRLPVVLKEQSSDGYGIYNLFNGSSGFKSSDAVMLSRELKSSALYREDRQYVRVLSFDYLGSYRFGKEYLDKVFDEYVFPVGYTFQTQEHNWNTEKIKRQYGLIVLILAIIFIICIATFESLRLPVFILAVIPLSFVGIFITFSMGDFYFDQGGYAAFILLAGIVVNATIFILNESSNYKSNKWNRNLIKACSRKFVPILLTIVSTCLGLVVFLVGGQKEVFWFAFSTGVIGGLLYSIFIVFIVFPILVLKK